MKTKHDLQIFTFNSSDMCITLCRCVQMSIDIHGIPKRLSDPLGLNIHQAVVSHPVWVLGTKLKSSDKVILSLNH